MVKVVGVAFKEVGKIYWFDPNNLTLSEGDKVVVETIRGLEIGLIVKGIQEVNEKDVFELKP
ncbi:MAG: stage 0 sporulation protein, partial [Bacilli bacterium]|nr:stage 0 sporulation protein [Bacilli bacterium]